MAARGATARGANATRAGRDILVAAAMLSALACGSTPEAAPPKTDGPPVSTAAVELVTCPRTIAYRVGVSGHAYEPGTQTVPVGSIVQFTTSADHSARAENKDAAMQVLFSVDFDRTECLRFNKADTYKFYCTAHGFRGSVVVQ